jgi:uncharacterized protein (DUF1499 family)
VEETKGAWVAPRPYDSFQEVNHMPSVKTIALIAGLAVAGWALTMAILSALARRPAGLGVRDGRLPPCPGKPNCVCSQDDRPRHAIEPLRFEGDPSEAWARLRQVVAGLPRTNVVTATDNYLHAECKTFVFRFTDDVEFLLDSDRKLIHVRSASRAGRSDFGVNRRRVESVRQAFGAD